MSKLKGLTELRNYISKAVGWANSRKFEFWSERLPTGEAFAYAMPPQDDNETVSKLAAGEVLPAARTPDGFAAVKLLPAHAPNGRKCLKVQIYPAARRATRHANRAAERAASGRPPHPGEVLYEQYLKPRNMTIEGAAIVMGLSSGLLSQVLNKRAKVTNFSAQKFAEHFEGPPSRWLKMQEVYDAWQKAQTEKPKAPAPVASTGKSKKKSGAQRRREAREREAQNLNEHEQR